MIQSNQSISIDSKKIKTRAIRKNLLLIVFSVNLFLLLINIFILVLITKLTQRVIIARSEILAQELQSQSAQKIISDLKAVEKDSVKLEKALPDKSRLLDAIELIESLNQITEVESFTFEREEPIEDSQGFYFLPLTIIVRGTIAETMTALQRLQSSPYLFYLNNTLIESPEGLSKIIRVRTSLRIYVRQPFTDNK